MTDRPIDLVARVAATERTVAKYRTRAFDWHARATCIHMARFHLRQLGHRPPSVPDFRSAVGARRALKKTGHDTVEALFDSLPGLVRLPAPSMMMVGDLATLEGDEDGLPSIVVSAGGKVLGWHEDDPSGLKPIDAHAIRAAWRT